MKKIIFAMASAALLGACSKAPAPTTQIEPVKYVDPLIGSGGHGHVFVGASVPYGMVQLGPTSIPQSWDWCSGYHESDSTLIGFSHTHLSGTGIGDLFDVTVMPVIGEVTYARGEEGNLESGMWSYADRSQEVVEPGYYRVPVSRYGIDAEMTATNRVGLHRYTFPASEEAALVFDLENGGCWDKAVATEINVESPTRLSGYRHSKGWADDQKVFFVAEFSKPMTDFSLNGNENRYGRVEFTTDSAEQILVKVAISPVSVEGAAANMAAELPGWDFEATREQAYNEWNDKLSNVTIETPDEDVKKIFYTGLYHTMISPVTFSDVDGQYRGADGNVYKAEGFTPYTVLSLWDTYRAALPFLSITDPERYADVINTMIDISEKQGRLPVWHLWGCETDCMVGDPGSIAVADAVGKGTPGIDPQRAMEALVKTASNPERSKGVRMQYGFIPTDKLTHEPIAFDMEYAIADGAIALAAEKIGNKEAADSFKVRSHSYRNYFDPSTRFMRGKDSKGNWRTPFDPFGAAHRLNDYCEGNAWQYTWLAPHDVDGLVECFGSKEAFFEKLDSLFIVSSALGEEASPDISGLIGQYAHGNEPSHHVLYLYTMLGEPDKTADLVRRTLDEMYTTLPDGLSGNEDAGQMSAWYLMSALGFYETEPGSARYWFGSPIVDSAEIAVPGGKFTIKANNNSPSNKYIRGVKLNGQDYTLPYITHDDIMKGGELIFEMSAE